MNLVRCRSKRRRQPFLARIIKSWTPHAIYRSCRLPSVSCAWKRAAAIEREAYDGDLKTFAEFIEGRSGVLLTATQQDVAAFLEHLRGHGIDQRSAARKLSCLRGFYKWLPA